MEAQRACWPAGVLILLSCAAEPLAAAPVRVRFPEGSLHGFLILRTTEGALIASGDLFQVSRNGQIESRTIFRFRDGSYSEESVVFSQLQVFKMASYRLVQRGPAFARESEISLDRASGKYRVRTKGQKGKEDVLDGTLELPDDVYNGMVVTVTKNLPERGSETVHIVAFTPEPRVIELLLAPAGEQQLVIGGVTKGATHYVLKPELGAWLKLFAKILGRVPPDSHVWIFREEVPAFVGFEGPLYEGPVWRIELTSPIWPG